MSIRRVEHSYIKIFRFSCDSPFIEWCVQYTMVPVKPLTDQFCLTYSNKSTENKYLNCDFEIRSGHIIFDMFKVYMRHLLT